MVLSSTSCPTRCSKARQTCPTVAISPHSAYAKNGARNCFSSSRVRYCRRRPPLPGVSIATMPSLDGCPCFPCMKEEADGCRRSLHCSLDAGRPPLLPHRDALSQRKRAGHESWPGARLFPLTATLPLLARRYAPKPIGREKPGGSTLRAQIPQAKRSR
jgi:hypothetical protein